MPLTQRGKYPKPNDFLLFLLYVPLVLEWTQRNEMHTLQVLGVLRVTHFQWYQKGNSLWSNKQTKEVSQERSRAEPKTTKRVMSGQ